MSHPNEPMPEYVYDLVKLPLMRLGLSPARTEQDTVVCQLRYDNDAELLLVVKYTTERSWLGWQKQRLHVSIVDPAAVIGQAPALMSDQMVSPSSPSDLPFTAKLSAKVLATVWALAATGRTSECSNLPKRPEWS